MQRELEVLSEQYSQKCLENAHLAQALEAERQALRQCQRENQELNAHNQVSRRPGEPQLELGAGLTCGGPELLSHRAATPSAGALASSRLEVSGPTVTPVGGCSGGTGST